MDLAALNKCQIKAAEFIETHLEDASIDDTKIKKSALIIVS